MIPRVKICGVNSQAAFDASVQAGADWVGFVFFPASPRFVTPAAAAALSARHAGGPLRVGLFVDPNDADIAAALAAVRLDVLQVYAPEARVAAVKTRFQRPVWRAVGVADAPDLPDHAGAANALVIEPKAPVGASRPGGNALKLDFSALVGFAPPYDWLLAGGLTPENVQAALAATRAPAVDVSSGVETAPGQKDAGLIAAFIRAAKQFSSPPPGQLQTAPNTARIEP